MDWREDGLENSQKRHNGYGDARKMFPLPASIMFAVFIIQVFFSLHSP